jgi:alanine or glycine:cation symporter, AGCS family
MPLLHRLRAPLLAFALLSAAPVLSAILPSVGAVGAQESSQDLALPVAREQLRDTAPIPIEGQQPEAATVPARGFMATLDGYAGTLNSWIGAFFFYDLLFWDPEHRLPFVVLWLVIAALFLTFRMGFINLRGFRHAVQVTSGRFSNPADAGEVSHFQALAAALSATVGLGNIAGVAIAVSIGGPGATFWMIIAGLLGMSAKFTECTLGQKYREVRPDGRVMGGAMFYLSKGLAELGMPRLGKFLAIFAVILCIGGSFGGGNAFPGEPVHERGSGNDSFPERLQVAVRADNGVLRRHRHHRRDPPHRRGRRRRSSR